MWWLIAYTFKYGTETTNAVPFSDASHDVNVYQGKTDL